MIKKAILILGMHRSGTSSLSGVLNIMGAYLGENLMPPSKDNEKGYFENVDICKLNEYILEKLNSSWHDTEELIYDNENFLHQIEYVIKTTFSNHPIIAIKDPRICLLLPLYESVLRKMDYEINIIKINRDTNEIINSLIARKIPNDITEEKCKKLIYKYTESMRRLNTPIINYSDLINNTDHTISYIKEHLPFLNYSDENINTAKQFLDKSLNHHNS